MKPTAARVKRSRLFSWATALISSAAVSCAGQALDPRYPEREPGCPVKSFPSTPPVPVDDLGLVAVDCSAGGKGCERTAFDLVCKKGGDVAWGLADNELTATRLVVHAAHSRRSVESLRFRGCAVRVLSEVSSIAVENIGPVTALCSLDDSEPVCTRVLEDEVCLLGGDAVWQVEGPTPEATPEGNKLRMRGRAVHTK